MSDDFSDLFASADVLDAYARRIMTTTDPEDAADLARNIYLAGVQAHHRQAAREIAALQQRLAEIQRKVAGS